MVKVAKDTPKWILDIFPKIDFDKIKPEQYKQWEVLIKNNIGKYLKERTKPVQFIEYDIPVKQDFLDIINRYNLNSLNAFYQTIAKSLVLNWIKQNLPLK